MSKSNLCVLVLAACGGSTTQASALPFVPSNVDLHGVDVSRVGDFVVDNDECTIDTDQNLASCGDGANVLAFAVETQSDGTEVAVYVARSMTIQAGQNLTVTGSRPFVFVALNTISIFGTLNANATFDVAVAGGQAQKNADTQGGGFGGGGAGTPTAAGGGGSYCGIGGPSGAESGPPANGGATYGNPQIIPLVGGSSGGAGDGYAGSGGGAIQLVAGQSITIAPAGLIQVGAGGGGFGGISGQEANGGGSGGSILLESLVVTMNGTLASNGGGGGAGSSSGDPGGANATPNATPAAGGNSTAGPSSGGDGSGASAIDGTAGSFSAGNSAGGGGGGAGRIRINTQPGQATVAGALSPAASTPCATQGAVTPL